jgi:hypothetical protein
VESWDANPVDATHADTTEPRDASDHDTHDVRVVVDTSAQDAASEDASDAFIQPDVPDTIDKCADKLWLHRSSLDVPSVYDAERNRIPERPFHADVEGSHWSFEGRVVDIEEFGAPEPQFIGYWLETTRPNLDAPMLLLSFDTNNVPIPDLASGEHIRWERVEESLTCVINPQAPLQFQVVHAVTRLDTGEVVYMDGKLAVFEDQSVGSLHPMNDVWDGLQWEDDECPVQDLDTSGIFQGGSSVRLVFPGPDGVTAKIGATDIDLPGFPDTLHISWPLRPDFANTVGRCGIVRFAMTSAPDAP